VTIRIPLPERTFQIWDDGWHTVPGQYEVSAAHALDDIRSTASVTL
jgi:beta-glucosidase